VADIQLWLLSPLAVIGAGLLLSQVVGVAMQGRGLVVSLGGGVVAKLTRLGRDRSRPLLQRGDREQVLRDLAATREPFYLEVADLMLDTDAMSPGAATTALAQLLATQWQRSEQAA
ncbi:MAG: shikimate kinase, partial [Pseudoxanthomonas sp.]